MRQLRVSLVEVHLSDSGYSSLRIFASGPSVTNVTVVDGGGGGLFTLPSSVQMTSSSANLITVSTLAAPAYALTYLLNGFCTFGAVSASGNNLGRPDGLLCK